ncbi:MAG: hypothetical protein WD990_01255 [Acidimicrobiia bacterium]
MDSIPWEALDTLGQPRNHRRWYVVAAAIAVVAVGISAARTLGTSSPEPVPVTTTTVTISEAEVVPSTTISPNPALVTEADLMAIEPHMRERSAAAFAEVAAIEYFSGFAEGVWAGVEFDRSRSTFVEYAAVVEVTPLSPSEFDVLVAVSVLDAAPDEAFTRRPVRGISIVVDAADGEFRPLGLPAPATLPFQRLEDLSTDSVTPGGDLLEAISRAGEEFGEVRSIEYREHPGGGGTATVTIVDEGGIGWPMALEVRPDGTVESPD